MAGREIVVVGGSAGGIEALLALVRGLPPDLPAAVFVVVHVPPYSDSHLPAILARAGLLPAEHARHGEAIAPGRIYVAPPDCHLLVRRGRMDLSRGPRENHSRPAIDPLFRSAARAYGPGAVGVVLSGALYDGAAGLLAVKGRGGVAIVQDPNEAVVPSMPRRALALVEADRIMPASAIGPELGRLTREPVHAGGDATVIDHEERIAAVIALDFAEQAGDGRVDETSLYTCPDCGGVMWQAGTGPNGRFRCHVGHAYVPEVLLNQKSEELEAALWTCVRLLREKATLTRQTATRTLSGGRDDLAARIEEQARLDERHAEVIRELLEAMPNPAGQTATVLAALDTNGGTDRAPG